jgi:hypothetical protein
VKRKLQVFVSSTFTDLVDERQAAVAANLKAGHIPAGMELFTAGDISQMETIKRWIKESDVYMLILGGRYGTIEPSTSLSYTELEYDYARELGKPLFAVVINEDALEERVKSRGTRFIERESPKPLAEFRKKVLTNISSFFSDHKDIKLCVHESLADLAANSELKGWVAASEIPDTKSLNAEIEALRQENLALSSELKKKTEQPSRSQAREISFEEMRDVLLAIELDIPEGLRSGNLQAKRTLLDVAYSNLDTLTNGVTNRVDASDVTTFFYFNVLPKLQAHGLADNERVPGVQYRRSFLNKAGKAFFAELQRKILAAKKVREAREKMTPTSAQTAKRVMKAKKTKKTSVKQ